jgi:hypothetical protein
MDGCAVMTGCSSVDSARVGPEAAFRLIHEVCMAFQSMISDH